ncbi:uncharacterized protein, partial [Amphiura filiformis]|uniref:uncharacterized protein n=1 Tax=Amphiura filiformis TaxID=82378 RepID=UPI003B221154
FAVPKERAYNEDDWPDVSNLAPYPKSKTLAEKSAWEFMKALPGRRHILVNKSLWMSDMAEILKAEFQQHGYNVSTMTLPKFLFKVVAVFDKEAREAGPMLNTPFNFDNTR